MASSSGEGSSSGDGRRYPHNLEGILRFAAEHTQSEDAQGATNPAYLDPENNPNPTSNHGVPPTAAAAASAPNDPELARINQDRALEVLGLHRYRVAGDGNCLFRAVAWQVKMDQEKYHPILRKAAQKWMRENKTELLEWGLLDGEQEIEETGKLGVWPGQAAIVALANILRVNIAVIQGGDKGDIDIQHICPFETASDAEQGSIILAYLYNGHYDAIVDQPDLENPEFEAWSMRRKQEVDADEALARKLAAEEGYDESASQPKPNHIQHVSEVHVSSSTQPLDQAKVMKQQPVIRHQVGHKIPENPKVFAPAIQTDNRKSTGIIERSESPKNTTLIQIVDQKNQRSPQPQVSPPDRPQIKTVSGVTRTVEPPLQPKPRRPPLKSAIEEERNWNDDNQIRITLYPKMHSSSSLDNGMIDSKRALYKPAPVTRAEGQLHVNRKPADFNVLQERQFRDVTPSSLTRKASPSIRVIPVQFVGRQSGTAPKPAVNTRHEIDRRPATRRTDVSAKGYNYDNSWGQQYSFEEHQDRPHYRPEATFNRQHATYSLYEDPAGHRSTVSQQPKYTTNTTYSKRATPRPPLHQGSTLSRDVPVVVLSARSPDVSTRARATPAPATYDLNKPFEMPPQLRPYKSALDNRAVEMMLRSNSWL